MRLKYLFFLILFSISVVIGQYFGDTVAAIFFWGAIGLFWIINFIKKINKPLNYHKKAIQQENKSQLYEEVKISPKQKQYDRYNFNDYEESVSLIGKTVKFTYEDSEGNITSRTVDVAIVTDFYIKGYCHKRRAERTFRIDRIIGDIELGSKRINPNDLANKTKRKQITKSYDYEVCFTGFKKATKEQLETLARIKGFLVRKSVTNNLNFLVTGDNAGFSKVAKAESMGITILTEEEFRNLLETGELPS
ncbi:BRCT domain-containing protein [Gallibacterium sp. ZY190522]